MEKYETIIIGAGPAGIQLAYFLQQKQRDYLVLEGSDKPGSFFRKYPRHGKLLSINKRYTGRDDSEFNLRHDWNSLLSQDETLQMRYYSEDYFPNAVDFARYLEDFAKKSSLNIRCQAHVSEISRCQQSKVFTIKVDGQDSLQCQRLVIATGVERPYIPNIPGIELATGYEEMDLDPKTYQNKNVLIIGKGNSALETADHLISHAAVIQVISPTPIKMAWDTRFVGHIRAVNNNFFDTYHLKSQNASMDGEIIKIWRNPQSNKIVVRFRPLHARQEIEQLEYDYVLRCSGFRFDTSLFSQQCQPQLTPCGKLPAMTSQFESTNIPNLFYAGALMQMRDYKKSQSAFVHGFRYNVRTLFNFLEERFAQQPWPSSEIPASADKMATALATYFNRISSLWQQSGFLADVLVCADETIQWYHDLPYDYVMENRSRFGDSYFVVMFRIQPCPGSTFVHARTSDVYEGEQNTAIHPVIEYYKAGEMVDKFHLLEDLLADWSGKEYVDSLSAFFKAVFAGEKFQPPQKQMAEQQNEDGVIREIIRDKQMKLKSAVV